MKCPRCSKATKVTDSNLNAAGTQRRRVHKCLSCETKFTTYERRHDDIGERKIQVVEESLANVVGEIERMKIKLLRVQNTKKTSMQFPLEKRYMNTGE